MECQPRDNPGYIKNERRYPISYEAKTLDFSTLCGPITGFGTQGSQVQILPFRPFIFRLFLIAGGLQVNHRFLQGGLQGSLRRRMSSPGLPGRPGIPETPAISREAAAYWMPRFRGA